MLDLGLDGKIAIITGGSDGLGRATAYRMASEGAKVVICGRRAEHLEQNAEALRNETGGTVLGVRADVCNADDCTNLIVETVKAFGGVDILVNNAGASAASSLEKVTDEEWRADFELKVMGAVRMCRGVVPIMRERGGGAIVNATIGGGKAPAAQALPTTLSRAAGNNLTKSLANEYAKDNIRVNSVAPGSISFPGGSWAKRQAEDPEGMAAFVKRELPFGRFGRAEEVGNVVAFLASPRSSWVSGASITVDGGQSRSLF